MPLASSESCILSCDSGPSFPEVSFHSASMFRATVDPLVACQKKIRNRLYVALLKCSLWPDNLFSLVFFPVILGVTLVCGFFFYLDLSTPNLWSQSSSFSGTCSTYLPNSSSRSNAIQTVAFFTLHTRLTQACPSCASNKVGVLSVK